MRLLSSIVACVLVLTLAGNARAEPSSLDVTRFGVGLAYLTAGGRVGNSSDSRTDVMHGGALALSVRAGVPDGGILQVHAQATALAGGGPVGDGRSASAVGATLGAGVTARATALDAWVAGSLWAGGLDLTVGSHTDGPWFGYELQVGQDVRHNLGWSLALARGNRIDEVGRVGSTHVTLSLVIGVR